MRHIIPVAIIALMLAAGTAAAQTAEDPAAEGNFSRAIPQGLMEGLTEDEVAGFRARLDAATTPQERNAVRQELQRVSRERHVERVQEQKRERKGLFENMAADFKDIVSGKAARDAKARDRVGAGQNQGADKGKSGGKDRGGKDRGDRGGGRNK